MHIEPIAARGPYNTRRTERRGWAIVVGVLVTGAVVLVLPFVVLLRGATYLYGHRGLGGWSAVVLALLVVAVVLAGYASWALWKLTRRLRPGAMFRWIAIPAVMLYGGYTLSYLSQTNAKSPEVRAHFRSLHPVLRVAVGTLTLWDRKIVVTDLARRPADYRRMGLPPAEASLHYAQADGYVHAADLRTRGRPWWRTRLTSAYFRLMGFETLRHTGTADHLHVALPLPRGLTGTIGGM